MSTTVAPAGTGSPLPRPPRGRRIPAQTVPVEASDTPVVPDTDEEAAAESALRAANTQPQRAKVATSVGSGDDSDSDSSCSTDSSASDSGHGSDSGSGSSDSGSVDWGDDGGSSTTSGPDFASLSRRAFGSGGGGIFVEDMNQDATSVASVTEGASGFVFASESGEGGGMLDSLPLPGSSDDLSAGRPHKQRHDHRHRHRHRHHHHHRHRGGRGDQGRRSASTTSAQQRLLLSMLARLCAQQDATPRLFAMQCIQLYQEGVIDSLDFLGDVVGTTNIPWPQDRAGERRNGAAGRRRGVGNGRRSGLPGLTTGGPTLHRALPAPGPQLPPFGTGQRGRRGGRGGVPAAYLSSLLASLGAGTGAPGGMGPPAVARDASLSSSRFQRDFEMVEGGDLGAGGFGKVFRVRHRIDRLMYAVKRVVFRNRSFSDAGRSKVFREVHCLARLDHPNVVRYYSAWVEPMWLSDSGMLANNLLQDGPAMLPELMKARPHAALLALEDGPASSHGLSHSRCDSESGDGSSIGGMFPGLGSLAGAQEPDIVPLPSESGSALFEFENVSDLGTGPAGAGAATRVGAGSRAGAPLLARCSSGSSSASRVGGHPLLLALPGRATAAAEALRGGSGASVTPSSDVDASGSTAAGGGASTAGPGISFRLVLYVQMEMCSDRTLRHWINERRSVCLERVLVFFRQLLSALNHVHANRIIHRDLKPSNCFMTEDGRLKLGDFGLSKETCETQFKHASGRHGDPAGALPTRPTRKPRGKSVDLDANSHSSGVVEVDAGDRSPTLGPGHAPDEAPSPSIGSLPPSPSGSVRSIDVRRGPLMRLPAPPDGSRAAASSTSHTGRVGTKSYASPEQMCGGDYDEKSDMYSLGLILLELICPFETGMERAMAFQAIRTKTKLPPSVTRRYPVLAGIVRRLVDSDPSARPSAAELLRHPAVLNPAFVPTLGPPGLTRGRSASAGSAELHACHACGGKFSPAAVWGASGASVSLGSGAGGTGAGAATARRGDGDGSSWSAGTDTRPRWPQHGACPHCDTPHAALAGVEVESLPSNSTSTRQSTSGTRSRRRSAGLGGGTASGSGDGDGDDSDGGSGSGSTEEEGVGPEEMAAAEATRTLARRLRAAQRTIREQEQVIADQAAQLRQLRDELAALAFSERSEQALSQD